MRRPVRVLAMLLMAVLPIPAVAQQGGGACSEQAHRQFDFWAGTWEVTAPDGSVAGQSTITPVMAGCVVHESYDGRGGYHGESFNAYDEARGVWHQTWVDNGGALLLLEGGYADGTMALEGRTTGADGAVALQRIRWSRVDGDPDRVRQLWETSSDDGATWTVTFDGLYTRTRPSGLAGRLRPPLRATPRAAAAPPRSAERPPPPP